MLYEHGVTSQTVGEARPVRILPARCLSRIYSQKGWYLIYIYIYIYIYIFSGFCVYCYLGFRYLYFIYLVYLAIICALILTMSLKGLSSVNSKGFRFRHSYIWSCSLFEEILHFARGLSLENRGFSFMFSIIFTSFTASLLFPLLIFIFFFGHNF